MISPKYINQIKDIIIDNLSDIPNKKKVKILIFGSALSNKNFNDIDIGIKDINLTDTQLRLIKEKFEESTIPYKIDIINFEKVDKQFSEKVFNKKIKWIT